VVVPLIEPKPRTFQSENWLLDPSRRWIRKGAVEVSDLTEYVDSPGSLWLNGHSSSHGRNDEVPASAADSFHASLFLLEVNSVDLHVFDSGGGAFPVRRKVQARFTYRDVLYWLSVTDPPVETSFRSKPDGRYPIGDCFLTISLAERLGVTCYKLVAAVIRRG
jgi:hypothetical protein